MKYIRLFPHDTEHQPLVLKYQEPSKRVTWRQKIADLACPKCKKLDERHALERGIDSDVIFSARRDFICSFEDLDIVSDRVRKVLDSFANSDVDYFDFPGVAGFYVALPRKIVKASPGDPAFRIINNYQCSACGRYREVCPGSEQPVIDQDICVGAIQYEGAMGAKFSLFVSEEVAKTLKDVKPRLTGISYDPTRLGS